MHRILIALLLTTLVACEEEKPPVRAKAPEATPPAARPAEAKPIPLPEGKAAAPTPAAPASAVPKVLLDPSLPEWNQKAPDEFKAKFTTSRGDITILVKREWSPYGADRFYTLVKNGYYDGVRFFRVISGFMAQFGIHGSPEVNAVWKEAKIPDDPVVQSNRRGMVSYAMRGPGTRTVQIFINYHDRNTRLDGMNFAPFGQVIEGMDVADKLYSEYGEGPPGGGGPNQAILQAQGNAYLAREFANLDYVKTARIVQP